MLIELCVSTAVPGQIEAYLSLFGQALRPAAEGQGARLLYLTVGDTGPLNEVVTAWAYPDMAAHAAAQSALRAEPQWLASAHAAGQMLRQQTRQLVNTTSFSGVELPPHGTRVIDLRTYSFLPERLQDFLPICESDGLPRQRVHCGALVFHGVSATGRGDQLIQAWAYASHADYDRGQAALFKDADWARGYRQRVIHLVDVQEHRLLRVLAASPAAGA